MATTTVTKRIIEVDVRQSKEAVKHLREMKKSMQAVEKKTISMGKNFSNVFKGFIAYNVIGKAREWVSSFGSIGDEMTSTAAKLSLVVDESVGAAQAMTDLFEIADKSRSNIDAVATLYTRLAASTQSLGTSHEELLNFTELVSDTFLLSGASAQEAASGITQISQAMAKGKLDGDEFKSIMESNVYFGTLLADTLKVNRGELLKMSKAGLITTETLLGMGGRVDELREKLEEMPLTVGQAFTKLGNAIAEKIGPSNIILKKFSELINGLANALKNLGTSGEKNITAGFKFGPELEESRVKVEALERQITALEGSVGSRVKSKRLRNLKNQLDELRADDAFYVQSQLIQKYTDRVDSATKAVGRMRAGAKDAGKDLAADLAAVNEAIVAGTAPDSTSSTKPKKPVFDEEAFKKAQERVKSILDGLRTTTEKYNDSLAELNKLRAQGAISAEKFAIAEERITQAYQESLPDMDAHVVAAQDYTIALNELESTSKSLQTPIQNLADKFSALDVYAERFPDLTEKVRNLQKQMAEKFTEDNKEDFIDWGRTAESAVRGVTGAFVDMAFEGKSSFADFAKSFLKNIASMILQAQVLKAIQSTPWGASLFGSANGNIINEGKIQPFATGGIVSQPTLFPLANGIGLMGEAGPEAIMPLKRGSDGKLGVEASGNMGAVNQTINVTGTGDKDLIAAMQKAAYEGYQLAVNDVKRNGPMRRMLAV